jgi:hypothetical protein
VIILEMGGICSTNMVIRNTYTTLVGISEGSSPLGGKKAQMGERN